MPDPLYQVTAGSSYPESTWRSSADCHACVFYAAPGLVVRALPLVETAVRSCRRVGHVQVHLWPCDVLNHPHLAHRALACAEFARIVVVIAAGNEEIDGDLTRWFEHWEESADEDALDRLLVFFHPCSPDRQPLSRPFRFLIERATRSGAGLIWRPLPEEVAAAARGVRESLAG